MMEDIQDFKIINKSALLKLLGLSGTTIERLESQGSFPKRMLLAAGRIGWIEKDVIAWIKSRPSEKAHSKGLATRKAKGLIIPQKNGKFIKLAPESRDVISIP